MPTVMGISDSESRVFQGAGSLAGDLRVRAARIGERTVLTDAFRTVPYHFGLPYERSGSGCTELILQEVGPGRLSGDRLRVTVDVEAGASLSISAQGANRIHPAVSCEPVVEDVTLSVQENGRLIWLPGEIIPFHDARYRQSMRISVAPGGLVAAGEIVTPGRVAMGEVYAFDWLEFSVDAECEGRQVYRERARLEPGQQPLHITGRHGRHLVSGTLYLIGSVNRPPDMPPADRRVVYGIASGDGYTIIRILGPTVQLVGDVMRRIADRARVSG